MFKLFATITSKSILLVIASPAGFHFCLETKTKQKVQGCFHFLTTLKTEIPKQA